MGKLIKEGKPYEMLMNEQKDSERVLLLAQARECFGKVAWSHQTHECQANLYRVRYIGWFWAKILMSIVAAVLATISNIFEWKWPPSFVVLASTFVAAAELILRNTDYNEKSLLHRNTATKLWRIREKYHSAITALKSEHANIDIERERMEAIADELEAIYANAPRTESKAYKQATKRLHSEACTCTDEEVDRLLPSKLRGGL